MTRITPDKSPLVLRNNDGRLELWFNGEKIPGILGFRMPETERGQRAIIEVVFTATAVKFDTHERIATESDKRVMRPISETDADELRQQFETVFPIPFPPAEPGPIPDGYTFDQMTGIFGRFHDGAQYVSERSHFHHKWYSRRAEFPAYTSAPK